MKKFAIALFAFFIFVQSYAQNCRPLQEIGVVNDATAVGWLSYSNANPSLWDFRQQLGQTNFVPSLSVQSNVVGTVVVATPCVVLNPTATHYELSFTFVGLTPGFTNALSVYLVGNTAGLVDGVNPLIGSPQLLGTFTDLPFGANELRLLITPAHFASLGSPESYRIAFRSLSYSRTIPGAGGASYNIESYLTNIVLREAQNHDLQLVAMTSPLSSCNLNNEFLSFTVKNRGVSTPATYNVCFRVSTDGGTSFGGWLCSQPFSDVIPFNETVDLQFTNHPQTFTSPLTVIEAQVQFSGQTSNTVRTNLNRTNTQTIPYGQSFDNPMFLETWSIIPGKTIQPNVTWHVPLVGHAMSGRAVIVTRGEASNDRLVSGCVQLEAGTRYQISFTYSALVNPNLFRPGSTTLHSTDPLLVTRENLRLYVGQSNLPADSDITLMDLRGFNNTDERTITTYFTPTTSGAHFFSFLAYSDANSAGIGISDFSIVEAIEPRTMPVFMSFEDYDNLEGWQTFSQNAIDHTDGNVMRGWMESTTGADVAHGGSVGLRTLSSPVGGSVITQAENNNNWLISPPIFMEEGVPVQIRYFRRAMVNNAVEILNIRVSEIFELDSLSRLEPLHRDTMRSNAFAMQEIYFTPTRTGVHFVTFQYNSENRRTGNHGMSLEEISIQCSVRAQDLNISVVRLVVPPPACQLSNNTDIILTIKNRTGQPISSGSLGSFFRLTNPAGETIVVRGNRTLTATGSGNFPAIPAHGTVSLIRRHNMTAIGEWEVQAWVASGTWSGTSGGAEGTWNPSTTPLDRDASDDTSAIVRTASTGTHLGRYNMGFEAHENIHFWRNSQTGRQSRLWWQFSTDPAIAHTGVGSAFVAPSETLIVTGENSQHITSPCLELSADTTYFISFFYRAVRDSNNLVGLNPVILNTFVGTNAAPLGTNFIGATSTEGLTYRQRTFYFRPDTSGTHYVILQAVSPRWSTGIVIDNFVILDSVSAHTPNLALNRIWTISANTCDLSDDILYVELVNNGLVQVVNPRFNIQFGGQTFSETWTGTIPSDTTITVRLNQRLTHTAFGSTNVTISLDVDGNLAEQTSRTASSLKTAPVQQMPFSISLQAAGEATTLGWNNLSLPFSEQIQPTFEYWSIGSSGAVFRPTHQAPFLSGVLASNCFVLQGGETYVIFYEYRGTSVANPENLHVQIERADGTIETLETLTNIRSTAFNRNSITFQASGNAGEQQIERIRFLSNYDHQALGIYIRNFSIMTQEQVSIADFHTTTGNLLSIHPNPATTEVFIQSEQEISTLFIHDIRGQLIREIRVNNTEYHLNTTDFPAGIYVFTIVVGNERVSKRIIIND